MSKYRRHPKYERDAALQIATVYMTRSESRKGVNR